MYYTIWTKYGALPERFNWKSQETEISGYPLRPELIESTYLLYQVFSSSANWMCGGFSDLRLKATKDPYYLQVGERLLTDLEKYATVPCGYATLSNVMHKTHAERMESFFLSETLKYLYLLFDTGKLQFLWENRCRALIKTY